MEKKDRRGGRPVENYIEWETKLPKETIGTCRRCYQKDLLGDGYCMNCWDKKISSLKSVEREWRERKKRQNPEM
jgi:hypothetical protein